MNHKKQKLELTWIGKDKRHRLEPRILLEDPEKSYHTKERVTENNTFDNKLIFGDNLLALKALEAEYTGKVKCIYIDPPFNTGAAFDNYDDGLEHSVWLSLMKERLMRLNTLLTDDGILFIHIDDKEQAYLKIILDETFGRSNFLNMMVVKTSDPSGHKTVNPSPYSQTEYVYMYAKNRQKYKYETLYVPTDYDTGYNRYIINIDDDYRRWQTVPLNEYVAKINGHDNTKEAKKKIGKLDFEALVGDFALENSNSVYQATAISNGAGRGIVKVREESKKNPDKVFYYPRESYDDIYILNGRQIYFYSNKVKMVDGAKAPSKPLTNIWTDIAWNGIANEGGVTFKNGKKPEKLLRRCIELGSKVGDIVLDSFAGSGTTAAVAHKMGRQWIAVELGEQCHTHIIPRMKRIIDGTDKAGISKDVNWEGGGGFRYYRLAPSMLEKDKWGNWVISKDYKAEMLAEAMCKHMGFIYAPDESLYWMQGHSTETDFIYVTTISLTHEQLRAISEEVGPNRTLLICCKAFNAKAEAFKNITLKKIPQAVLKKCEWGKDDYSLNVTKLEVAGNNQTTPDLFEQKSKEA